MRTIVFVDLNKIDGQTKFKKGISIEPTNQLTDETILVPDEAINVFIPSSSKLENASVSVNVYFELEQYPFFHKVKEKIKGPKGVLRFRRETRNEGSERLLASDLLVFSSLLGEPESVQVKRTKQEVNPYHIIVTVNFGGGTMAHLEYTFSSEIERIELEWSGIKNIIEFDSKEMNPIDPNSNTNPTLTFSVDSIFATAHKADQEFIETFEKYSQLISGGTK